jgi:hypothetical protein
MGAGQSFMAKGNFFRSLRQLILLTILLMVATGSYLTQMRSTSWEEPLWVTLYPIDADGRQATKKYIDALTGKPFMAIERFMEQETRRYGVDIDRPIRIDIGLPVDGLPPAPPVDRNPFKIALWSLELRWWAYQATKDQTGATPDIRLFIVYHDPDISFEVMHSLAMQKGMLGIVHAFADRRLQNKNNVVIAHEMLHTLGATDKYARENNLPLYPIGYAEPDGTRLYPQRYAEIMGGRIPLSESEAVMPDSLRQVRVGGSTALEIRWIDALEKEPVTLGGADGQMASE